jgi:hypothetical protein
VSIKDRVVGCVLLQQALSCVLTHTQFMGSHKLSSLTVVELDDNLPHFTDGIGIVFEPPRTTRRGFHVEDGTRLATHDTCVVHVCHIVRLFPLQGDYSFESPRHPRIWVRLVHYVQT